jgi:hypothetical protein
MFHSTNPPVVAHHRGFWDAEVVQQCEQVAAQLAHVLRLHRRGRIRETVAAHVGRDAPEAARGARGGGSGAGALLSAPALTQSPPGAGVDAAAARCGLSDGGRARASPRAGSGHKRQGCPRAAGGAGARPRSARGRRDGAGRAGGDGKGADGAERRTVNTRWSEEWPGRSGRGARYSARVDFPTRAVRPVLHARGARTRR